MTVVRSARAATVAAVLIPAVALATGCERRGAAPTAATTGASATVASTATHAASMPAGTGVLVLDGKAVHLEVRCLHMGEDVLIASKPGAGDEGSVDVEHGEVRYSDFTVDGVKWMWEPTSTGGAREPSVAKDGKTYTVTGGVHQLDDYKKLGGYTFTATCPE